MGTWAKRGMARAEKFQFKRAPKDGSGSSSAPARDFGKSLAVKRVAREALIKLQASPPEERPRILKTLSSSVMRSLEEFLLICTRAGGQALQAPETDFADKGLNSRSVQLAGVMVDKNDRYSVEMTWDGLRFRTHKTRFSEEVIDWHISLSQMKVKAQTRIRKAEAEGRADDESYYPLTEPELAEGYRTSPTMRLAFLSQHMGGKPSLRCVTPCTHNLTQALQFKKKFAELFEKCARSEKLDVPFPEQVHRLKKQCTRACTVDKLEREQTERLLLQEVNAELSVRGGEDLAIVGLQADIPEEVTWHDEAKTAMEIRDLLQLDHTTALQVAETLRGLTLAQREAVRNSMLEPEAS